MDSACVPTATYRLQLTPDFDFTAAADVVPYLAELGVSHVYCSPVLEAAPGSTHGYDVVDPTRLRDELGGPGGFATLVAACRRHHLGIVVDVVPNHMHVGAPENANAAWWDVLRRGRSSPFAAWFDIDWDAPGLDGKVLVPILDDDTQVELFAGCVRVGEHRFPIADGTDALAFPELLAAQHYRLAHWREESRSLNYRRFFGIATLAGVRVETPAVFGATHQLIGALARTGVISGLRIDHPDGLADPAGYLDALAEATGGVWTVVEKILEVDEQLPAEWRCAGTTGYDALGFVDGLFVDSAAEPALTSTYADFIGEPIDWNDVVRAAKTAALQDMLGPEVARLSRLSAAALGEPLATIEEAVRALLVAMPVYRVYVRPGEPPSPLAVDVLAAAAMDAARALPPETAKVIDRVRELMLNGPAEIVTRFQQTTGPAMAKGVEDTAFYRFHRLVSLCEVGGDPSRFGRSVPEFHAFCSGLAARHPATMTALSTHDTKRSEDVRARLAVLTELSGGWDEAVQRWSAAGARHWHPPGPDRNVEYLFWQTLVGAWPIDLDRVTAYVEKAAREAGQRTAWVDGDEDFDNALATFVRNVLTDDALCADVTTFVRRIAPAALANTLGQKLVQLTMPGVPDLYQGCEVVDLSLVDPDNRRPVDFAVRRRLLAGGGDPKLHVVTTALRARRDLPDCFGPKAAYTALSAEGSAADHVVAFGRGDGAVTLAARLSVRLAAAGGWRDTTVALPQGRWTNLLNGREFDGGRLPVADVLDGFPVALLGKTSRTHS